MNRLDEKTRKIIESLDVIRKYSNDDEYRKFLSRFLLDYTNDKKALTPEQIEELVYLQERETVKLQKKN